MNSVVMVREIWDTRDIPGEVLDSAGHPRWQAWEGRFDPEDLNALEMALQLKDNQGGRVTALTVGPTRKLDVLRECLYRGVDQTMRISVDDKQNLDILNEARLLTAAVSRIDDADILFTGIQLNEGEHAQRGAMAARLLGWPLVSYVEEVKSFEGGLLELRRAIEGGIQLVEVRCPVVVSVGVALVKEDPRAPRSAKAKLKLKHKKTPIPEWGRNELANWKEKLEPQVRIVGYRPVLQRQFPSRRVDGSSEEELNKMFQELKKEGLLRW